MRIVVGTDFSSSARRAADLAASLASRWHAELVLVHALERLPAGGPEPAAAAHARLEAAAARLRAGGTPVVTELASGPAPEALLGAVARHRAGLVAIGVVGQRPASRWVVGSTTDQVAQASPVPVLGMRFEEALDPWLHGEEPLRVLYADDGSAASAAALSWAARFAGIGPLALTAARVLPARETRPWWPFSRREGPRPAAAVERQLVRSVRESVGAAEVRAVVRRTERPVADELLVLAAEARVGLILAGARERTVLRRLWSTSVSRALLAGALVSVLIVPESAAVEARPGAGGEAAGLPA